MADSAPPVVRRIVDAMESVAPQTSIAPPALTATAAPSPAPSEAPAPPTPTRPRNLTLDWLRVLGICAVLVIHLGEVFNPWDEWHVSNPVRSRLAGEVVVFFAPWIMPMMFLVAGWSSCYALERRPNRRFVRERFVRLGIPLVLGVLLLVPPQVYLERRLREQFTGSLVAFYPHFFDGIYPQGNFSWHHLWFLGHLLVYSLVALPLFRYWRSERGRLQLRRIATWCAGPFGLLWLAAPLVLERHVLWWLLPARAALTVDWANHAILFVAFVYGYMLAAEPAFLTDLDQQWKSAARFAIAMSAALWAMAWRGLLPNGIPEPYSTGYLAFWSIYGVGAWAWVVFVIGVARRVRWRDPPLFVWARDRSYAWYLVHQPVVVAAAVAVIPTSLPLGAKVAAFSAISIVGTVIATEALAHFRVTRVMLGLAEVRERARSA